MNKQQVLTDRNILVINDCPERTAALAAVFSGLGSSRDRGT